jgi:hypothetical protein
MQEVLNSQLQGLHRGALYSAALGLPESNENDWAYVGVGRDDGQTKGEYSPIFYRKSAWDCIHSETIWLNENGAVGRKGWDAGSVRILTCAVLESKASDGLASSSTRGPVLAMNTHLDNDGKISRRESAKIILNVAARLRSKYKPAFTFLCGDLNSPPDDDAYLILNREGSGFIDCTRLLSKDLADPQSIQPDIYPLGNTATFTGFPKDPAATGRELIDFIHLGTPSKASRGQEPDSMEGLKSVIQSYGVLPNRFDDHVWLSDHRVVIVDLLVPL